MNDLISRQAAIAKFESWLKVEGYSEGELNMLKAVLFELTVMPPAVSSSQSHENDAVSRQAAIDVLCSVCGVDCDKSKFVYGGKQEDQVILCPEHYALTQLPSAQPEIIHCMDCDWWTKQDDSIQGRCALMGAYPTGWWFCGNAKRKDGETE